MENKNKIIITMAILAIAVVITAVLLTVMNKSNNEEVNNIDVPQANLINGSDSTVPEYFDVNKIIESQITESEDMGESQVSILESPNFSIPKDVSGIEMMTVEEKISMGIDENLNVQILGRNEVGQVTGYQFIYSEEDFIIDLR